MIPGCPIEKLCGIFASAFEQFDSLVTQLQDETSANMEHGQVETLIFEKGMELLRRLFQAHLDVRCERETPRESVLGCDGILRTHCRCGCERSLMSRFGEVIVRRKGYSAPGADSLFPLDRELNLPSDKYSEGLQYLAVRQIASESFDRVVENVREETAGSIPKRQLEEITSKSSVDFDTFYSRPTAPEVVSDLLVISTDGKGIVMREDDLRPATRKAAKEQKHEPDSRLQPGQKPNRKRMATVAAVYSVEAQERSAEQIMGQCEEQPPRPRATNKRVWASVEKDSEEVIKAAFEEGVIPT